MLVLRALRVLGPQRQLGTCSPAGAADTRLSCFSGSAAFPTPRGRCDAPACIPPVPQESFVQREFRPYPRAELKAPARAQETSWHFIPKYPFHPSNCGRAQITAVHRAQSSREKWSHGEDCSWDVAASSFPVLPRSKVMQCPKFYAFLSGFSPSVALAIGAE